MAKAETIFQPFFPGHTHKQRISKIFARSGAKEALLATAFLNSAGVQAIERSLRANARCLTCYVGVRNGATTVQGLIALIRTGARVYVVDTGSFHLLFHPKFYAIRHDDSVFVILGSANSTHFGLHNNIETSILLTLDAAKKEDRACYEKLSGPLNELVTKHPQNCYRIGNAKQAMKLFEQGLLEDERNPRPKTAVGGIARAGKERIAPRISLPFVVPPRRASSRRPKVPKPAVVAPSTPSATTARSPVLGDLVWEKPRLAYSDLQIPRRPNSKRTGNVRLSQSKFEVGGKPIDWKIYFRNEIFGGLNWQASARTPSKELASARFFLIVSGVSVGEFILQLSHDPHRISGQSNVPTWLHWGTAAPKVQRPELLRRALKLYAPAFDGAPYGIEID